MFQNWQMRNWGIESFCGLLKKKKKKTMEALEALPHRPSLGGQASGSHFANLKEKYKANSRTRDT